MTLWSSPDRLVPREEGCPGVLGGRRVLRIALTQWVGLRQVCAGRAHTCSESAVLKEAVRTRCAALRCSRTPCTARVSMWKGRGGTVRGEPRGSSREEEEQSGGSEVAWGRRGRGRGEVRQLGDK